MIMGHSSSVLIFTGWGVELYGGLSGAQKSSWEYPSVSVAIPSSTDSFSRIAKLMSPSLSFFSSPGS